MIMLSQVKKLLTKEGNDIDNHKDKLSINYTKISIYFVRIEETGILTITWLFILTFLCCVIQKPRNTLINLDLNLNLDGGHNSTSTSYNKFRRSRSNADPML